MVWDRFYIFTHGFSKKHYFSRMLRLSFCPTCLGRGEEQLIGHLSIAGVSIPSFKLEITSLPKSHWDKISGAKLEYIKRMNYPPKKLTWNPKPPQRMKKIFHDIPIEKKKPTIKWDQWVGSSIEAAEAKLITLVERIRGAATAKARWGSSTGPWGIILRMAQ